MNYKAVEVIWIFLADRRTDPHTDRRTEVFQEVLADLKRSGIFPEKGKLGRQGVSD